MRKTRGMSRTSLVFALVATCFLVCGGLYAADAQQAPGTLGNLMKAYDGESNAHARYLAFAKKADEEGYGQVASLFRAAASAEQIHLTKEAQVIQAIGGTPQADVKTPEVKSTKENLDAAVKGESYERDTMYPGFIKIAESEKIPAAVEAFNEAKGAEASHAKLYKEALNNLEAWKGAKKDFYVCPECGNTVLALTFAKCPICATPKAKFNKVS